MTKDHKKKLNKLIDLCTLVSEDMECDRYEEGSIGDCRWRTFGIKCASKAAGYLHLADNKRFDRWANSCTIEISLLTIAQEEGDIKEVVEKAVAIYA